VKSELSACIATCPKTKHSHRPVWFTPAIFGLADGAMSIVGVILYASGHSTLVFPIALSGGLSAAMSMAGSQWLSQERTSSIQNLAMGAATLAGSIAPALPYLFLHGWHAPAVSIGVLVMIGFAVAHMRKANRKHPHLETFAVLAAILVVSVLFSVFI
jgi:VIT1/CCC1 family predicted Fe2+/Mn2+ transporter